MHISHFQCTQQVYVENSDGLWMIEKYFLEETLRETKRMIWKNQNEGLYDLEILKLYHKSQERARGTER